MLLQKGEVDGLICGTWGITAAPALPDQVIGRRSGSHYACMNGADADRQIFLVDTQLRPDPEQLAEITTMAAEEMMRFRHQAQGGFATHSNFGSGSNQASAVKMRQTLDLLRTRPSWLYADGEMHGDVALDGIRRVRPSCRTARSWYTLNPLVFPTSIRPTSLWLTCSKQRQAVVSR